ncbi:hypothetical protein [Spiroplasma phoeniceum]|uniref:hypothetical protein n=1 Tax=Spiroplasma phoeniceum TaxID=47835 RepID=UPI00164C5F5B|nr:hypothetical protein [Spiroplasma phoeniceum]
MIENLPFKKSMYIKLEEQLKIVVVKDVFDYQLEEFAKVVMEFWHCFKLETYYENYRLVFKVNQAVFDKVLNSASVLKKNLEIGYIGAIFTPIFNFFNKRTSDLQGTLKGADVVSNNLKYKVNYTKNEKSLTIKLLHKGWVYSYNDISLSYFTFMNNEFNFYYSFFINVMWKDINVDNNKYSFLQIINRVSSYLNI